MRVKASEVIGKLMGLGVMATMNQSVDVDTAMLIAADFGWISYREDGSLKGNLERAETEEKLKELGLAIPWLK